MENNETTVVEEYLSVKAFAEKAGVSTQRVYQLLAKDLQSYCKVIDGVKFIHKSALSRFVKEQPCKPVQEDLSDDFASLAKTLQDQIDTLKQHNALLAQQLEVKDNLITGMQQQISTLTESLHDTTAALTAAQALHAGTIQQQLTDRSGSSGEHSEDTVAADTEPKRNFWQRLFKKS